jgi:hypothetical protein
MELIEKYKEEVLEWVHKNTINQLPQ